MLSDGDLRIDISLARLKGRRLKVLLVMFLRIGNQTSTQHLEEADLPNSQSGLEFNWQSAGIAKLERENSRKPWINEASSRMNKEATSPPRASSLYATGKVVRQPEPL